MASKIKVNAIEVSTGSEIKIGTAVTVTSSSVSATSFQGDGANLTNITGANITGTIPESALSNVNLDTLNANIAMLGFKVAVNGSLTKYSLVDQVIDEYEDASGIDASASTNETLTSGVYYGGSTTNPTQDADAATTDGAYKVYKWTDTGSTGTFTPNVTGSYEYLVVAGGGAGGRESYSFGTGGGGFILGCSQSGRGGAFFGGRVDFAFGGAFAGGSSRSGFGFGTGGTALGS